jgi:hypothetical protein
VTAIWRNDGTGWALLPPVGFPDEVTLHSLVEQAPQLLPLAGSPSLVIVGREVQLGSGWADLIVLEPLGRVVLIEIKLARNAEARRAVVAQVLTYAAYLYGMSPATFEGDVLGRHLRERGYDTLASAVASADQEGAFDAEEFSAGLEESLSQGRFRLVIVLDAAPEELIRLVGYLTVVSDKLLIDLVTVTSYDVGGSAILVPQRVDPERHPEDSQSSRQPRHPRGRLADGADDFVATIDRAPVEERTKLQRLAEWALALEREGLARLSTFHGTGNRWTLLPRLQPENVGLVTIWNDGGAYIQLWRSVFERRAASTLPTIEARIAPKTVRQGSTIRDIDDATLAALTLAYREAAGNSGGGFSQAT